MADSIGDYLDKAGAVELLCELGPHGSRFNELDQSLEISHQTLSVRLQEGVELSLLDQEVVQGERGTNHKYVLAPKGSRLWLKMEEEGVVERYYIFKEDQRKFSEKTDEIRKWASENEAEEFANLKMNHSSLMQLKETRSEFEGTTQPGDSDDDE